MKCEICDREAKDKFCEPHEKAYKNIVKTYDAWRSALNLSWEEYLNEVSKNSYTGSWAREVAEYLMKREVAEEP